MLMTSPVLVSAELAQSLGPQIDAALDARTRLGDGCPARLREAMRYSLLAPGKRLRPMLVLLAAEAAAGRSRRPCRRPVPSRWSTPIR